MEQQQDGLAGVLAPDIILPPLPIATRTLRDAVASTAAICSAAVRPSGMRGTAE
jgi:hypothetical protein